MAGQSPSAKGRVIFPFVVALTVSRCGPSSPRSSGAEKPDVEMGPGAPINSESRSVRGLHEQSKTGIQMVIAPRSRLFSTALSVTVHG